MWYIVCGCWAESRFSNWKSHPHFDWPGYLKCWKWHANYVIFFFKLIFCCCCWCSVVTKDIFCGQNKCRMRVAKIRRTQIFFLHSDGSEEDRTHMFTGIFSMGAIGPIGLTTTYINSCFCCCYCCQSWPYANVFGGKLERFFRNIQIEQDKFTCLLVRNKVVTFVTSCHVCYEISWKLARYAIFSPSHRKI